jgi:hypothetical protein
MYQHMSPVGLELGNLFELSCLQGINWNKIQVLQNNTTGDIANANKREKILPSDVRNRTCHGKEYETTG